MRCYRKILFILYKDHVTNEEVRAKIQLAFGPQEDLLIIIKKHKLQWYWHVSRLSGLAKTILQGTVKGGRRQGRQRNRWEDNIREWAGLEFAKSQRTVENREKWRKLVVKSSVVPQRPSRLRDRWEMRDENKLHSVSCLLSTQVIKPRIFNKIQNRSRRKCTLNKTYTNIKHNIFEELVPSVLPLLRKARKAKTRWYRG